MGQWEAGTQVYRLRKEARSGMTERSPMGRLTLWDNGKLGLGCTDLGLDGVVRGHWRRVTYRWFVER